MTRYHGKWRPLEEDMPIVSAAGALEVEILAARPGYLRLDCLKGNFPEGELFLVLSNWAETSHWYAPARLDDGVLEVEMTGIEIAWNPEENKAALLFLAKKADSGLIQYPLRAARLLPKLRPSARNPYYYNEQEIWGEPVTSFLWEERFYEVLPRFIRTEKKTISLAVEVAPRSFRYWRQMSYCIQELSVVDGKVTVAALPAEGGPELDGFALHLPAAEGEEYRFFSGAPAEDGRLRRAVIDLAELPDDGREYRLSGVVEAHDGLMFYVPLSIIDPDLHQNVEELANGYPLVSGEKREIRLSLGVLCRPVFSQTGRPSACQQEIGAASLKEALDQDLLPQVEHCAIRDLGGEDWQWHFEVPHMTLTDQDEILVLAQRKSESCRLAVTILSSNPAGTILSVDFKPLAAMLQNSLPTCWDLNLAIRQGADWYNMRLRNPQGVTRRIRSQQQEYMDFRFTFGAPVGSAVMGEQTIDGLICCTANGFCQIQTADRIRRYERQLVCRAELAKIRGTRLKLRVRCPNTVPGHWTKFALVRRYKLEMDREVFFFDAEVVEERDQTWLTADVDLSQFTFSPLYWDIRAVFEGEDGVPYLVPARVHAYQESSFKSALRRRVKQLERTIFSGSYRQGEDLSVSLYTTADRNYALVCQDYSPYSGVLFRMKERIALILAKVFQKQLAEKSIFLVYEKYCCMAQDNGYYFFKHCMDHDMEKRMNRSIYFVIDKKQPDYEERLLPYQDHVIQFMSLKHMVYILAARLLISSDSKAHAYAWRAKESIILPRVQHNKKLVFLQHGVIALKRVEFYSKGTNAVSLFVTSNQREHDIIVDEMAYAPEDVIITGLARWDVLKDKPIDQKRILIMPTWRNWLEEVSDAVFMASDYYRNYMALLNDPRLAELLEKEDLYLDFYIHPKFREYLSNFSISAGERVRLIPFGSEPLNELMMECRMLITDYSSVCWDVYYQGKPVLFYQFDVDKYNETTGSYIDMETELFGDRVMTAEALLAQIQAYARNDFKLPEVYAQMRPKMYAYLDHNNSQRTCEEIMKRNW
ncbi:MAG: CDP-glycerol glycerophosphotransferase family protein [Oscillospiraceae bacterium]|nr:CDP-glycerol glycerophosphotransferase family protein [Oscillospiraceae bacterium]